MENGEGECLAKPTRLQYSLGKMCLFNTNTHTRGKYEGQECIVFDDTLLTLRHLGTYTNTRWFETTFSVPEMSMKAEFTTVTANQWLILNTRVDLYYFIYCKREKNISN